MAKFTDQQIRIVAWFAVASIAFVWPVVLWAFMSFMGWGGFPAWSHQWFAKLMTAGCLLAIFLAVPTRFLVEGEIINRKIRAMDKEHMQ
jgi:hypothetical protein